jgi:hypothetical protein
VALLSLALFAGTLTIFVVAPAVTGFPLLTLMGQFILKDTVLASAAITLVARDAARHEPGLAKSIQPSRRPQELRGQTTIELVANESNPYRDASQQPRQSAR